MRLKNIVIVVKDIEKSKKFYHDVFGLEKILENEGNIILTEGLVLQKESAWKQALGRELSIDRHSCELYFEEKNIEDFIERLEKLYPKIEYMTGLRTYSWGKKIVRFYDLDRNLIEVGTPD